MKTFPIVMILVTGILSALAAIAGWQLLAPRSPLPAPREAPVSPNLANGVNRWNIPPGEHLHQPGPDGTIHLPPHVWVPVGSEVRAYFHAGMVAIVGPGLGEIRWVTREQFFQEIGQARVPYGWLNLQPIEKPR